MTPQVDRLMDRVPEPELTASLPDAVLPPSPPADAPPVDLIELADNAARPRPLASNLETPSSPDEAMRLPSRCEAIAESTKTRCQNIPIFGSTLCRLHGGITPLSKHVARLRLAELVSPALARLEYIINDPQEDTQCVLRAIKDALDRNGFSPVNKVAFAGVMGTFKREELEKFSDDELGVLIQAARLLAPAGGGAEAAEAE